MKYIIVTGGVISSIGKGITAASIAFLLKSCGFNVTLLKIDPYLNIDAGTMSPFEHGECYVLNDGSETDLDLGNYERFLNTNLTHNNIITTGKIYQSVISKERTGYYLGKTVQVVPHIIDEIIAFIKYSFTGQNIDICIIELGGTIGDIESQPFTEALRQLKYNENASKGVYKTIYKFNHEVLEGMDDLEITKEKIKLKGYQKVINLKS